MDQRKDRMTDTTSKSVGKCPVSTPYGRVGIFDPPPELMRISAEEPLRQVRLINGETGWLASDYETSRAVLTDRRFSNRRIYGRQPYGSLERWMEVGRAEEEAGEAPFVNEVDPPDHTRRRRAMMSHLTAPRLQERRERFQKIIDGALDAMEEAGPPADFMELLAFPVPALVICDLFAIAEEDRHTFVDLSNLIRDPAFATEEIGPANEQLFAYTEELIADRRRNLGDDILSAMILGGDMTDEELVKDVIGVFEAGHETTSAQLGFTLLALLTRRERWDALKADPSTIDSLVEESLRYLTVADMITTERLALEDIELGGATIKEGETVVISVFGPNRDPKRFPDPDEFDPCRNARGHLAFGWGIHMCLGQHVARLEVKLAFTSLPQRFPDLELAIDPGELTWLTDDHQVAGPTTLPVKW
jgi:cytochrome P450